MRGSIDVALDAIGRAIVAHRPDGSPTPTRCWKDCASLLASWRARPSGSIEC
jgi:hypothetical protein